MKDKFSSKIFIILIILILVFIFTIYKTKDINKEKINVQNNSNNSTPLPSELEKKYCALESREPGACISIYEPVCGWFNENIKCIKYPCAKTYGNSCEACKDKNVEYWSKKECSS